METVIKELVKAEIEKVLGESSETIKEAVASTLLPELKKSIRAEILKSLEQSFKTDVGKGDAPALLPKPATNQSAIPNPKSVIGLYLYCLADGGHENVFGPIGIESRDVYTLDFGSLSAVVHNCVAEPYQSEDQEKVREWVLAHQRVVDKVWKTFGTVIPIGFDTIIADSKSESPIVPLKAWIEADREDLKSKLKKVRNRAEYGVQIFWETRKMARKVSDEIDDLKRLQEKIRTKPRGVAYMLRHNVEKVLKNSMSRRADECFQEFYQMIKPYADDIRFEKTKKAEDDALQMLLNLSCLLTEENRRKLGDILEAIDGREAFSVRYTGPWPPYSFV